MDPMIRHDPNALPSHMKDNHGNLIPEYLKPAPYELRSALTYHDLNNKASMRVGTWEYEGVDADEGASCSYIHSSSSCSLFTKFCYE